MEKDKKYKIIVFAGLILLVICSAIIKGYMEKERDSKAENPSYTIQKKEKSKKVNSLNKQRIYSMKNQRDDNLTAIEKAENSKGDMGLEFIGYDSQDADFEWLQEEDWERFKRQAGAYLETKNLSASKVTLHADSQQVISEHIRYLYFDIDYATEYSETLLIKAICDDYSGELRFEFEVQYAD